MPIELQPGIKTNGTSYARGTFEPVTAIKDAQGNYTIHGHLLRQVSMDVFISHVPGKGKETLTAVTTQEKHAFGSPFPKRLLTIEELKDLAPAIKHRHEDEVGYIADPDTGKEIYKEGFDQVVPQLYEAIKDFGKVAALSKKQGAERVNELQEVIDATLELSKDTHAIKPLTDAQKAEALKATAILKQLQDNLAHPQPDYPL